MTSKNCELSTDRVSFYRSLGDMTYFSWNQERGRGGKKELKVTNTSNAGLSAGNTTTQGNE